MTLSLSEAALPFTAPLPGNFHEWPAGMRRRYCEHALGEPGPGHSSPSLDRSVRYAAMASRVSRSRCSAIEVPLLVSCR